MSYLQQMLQMNSGYDDYSEPFLQHVVAEYRSFIVHHYIIYIYMVLLTHKNKNKSRKNVWYTNRLHLLGSYVFV